MNEISITVKKDEFEGYITLFDGYVEILDCFIELKASFDSFQLLEIEMSNGCGICYELRGENFRFEFDDCEAFIELTKYFDVLFIHQETDTQRVIPAGTYKWNKCTLIDDVKSAIEQNFMKHVDWSLSDEQMAVFHRYQKLIKDNPYMTEEQEIEHLEAMSAEIKGLSKK